MSDHQNAREITSSSTAKAMLLMLGSTFSFAVMGICIKQLSADMHSSQIVFLRSVISVLMMLPLVVHYGVSQLKVTKANFKLHFWRSFIGIFGMELWFYSLATMPVNEATALSFTAPLFATIIAVLFLKEQIGLRRVIALIIGFLGVLVIIRPSAEYGLQLSSLLVLGATVLWSVSSIFVKQLTKREPDWKTVFYMALFMSLFSAPISIHWWGDITWTHFFYLCAIAFTGLSAHWFMTAAFSRADVVNLMSLDFTRLIFTAILAFIFLNEIIDLWTMIGAIIITLSCVYIAIRSRKGAKFVEEI